MKLNIIAVLVFFILPFSSYAVDSDDEAFLFLEKLGDGQAKKRPYASEEYSSSKKLKLDSIEETQEIQEIKGILYNCFFNKNVDLSGIVNIKNFFDIVLVLLLDDEYNEQMVEVLCLIIKEKSLSIDARLRSATILAKSTGSLFFCNMPFKIKGLEACLSILHFQEQWLINFFESAPYQDEDYKALLFFAESSYVKGVQALNPNNILNWSDSDYRKILHTLALIGSENYESILQHTQKNFLNDWSGDRYFNFIQKSFAMIEFGVFRWPSYLRYNIAQELYSIYSEKFDDLVCFIKIIAEPFWTPQHYIEIIKTFTSIQIKDPQLIANATKKIARSFWMPDHYVAAIKAFNNVRPCVSVVNNVRSIVTDTPKRTNILVEFVNSLLTIDWTPDHYKEAINAFESTSRSYPVYIVDAIMCLRSKVTHFTSNQLGDVIRALNSVSNEYTKKIIDLILSISLNDWTAVHFTEVIKAFCRFHKVLSGPDYIDEVALAVKAFAEQGRSAAFYASVIDALLDIEKKYIPETIEAVQKLSLPMWTELHYPKIITAFSGVNTNREQNDKIINIIKKLCIKTLNVKDNFCLAMNEFNYFDANQVVSFDKMESFCDIDSFLGYDSRLWTPELYYDAIIKIGNIIIDCSSEQFDVIVAAIEKISLNDWTLEHYQKIINGLYTIVKNNSSSLCAENCYLFKKIIDNYVYVLESLALKNGAPAYYSDFIGLADVADCKILIDVMNQYDLTSWKQDYFYTFFDCMKLKKIDSEKYADIIKLIHFFTTTEEFNESNIDLLIRIANSIDPLKISATIDFSINFFQTKYIGGNPNCHHMIFVFLFLIQQTEEIDYQKISNLQGINHNVLNAVFSCLCYTPGKYRLDLIKYFIHKFDDFCIDFYLTFTNYLKSLPQEDWHFILMYFVELIEKETNTTELYKIRLVISKLLNNSIDMAEYVLFSIIEKSASEDLEFYAFRLIFSCPALKEKQHDKIKQYLLNFIQNESDEYCVEIVNLLTTSNILFNEYKEFLKSFFKKITSYELSLVKLRGYIICGEFFREEYDQLVQSNSFMTLLEGEIDELIDEYGETHPRIQELLILYAGVDIDEDDEPDSIRVYANLLLKLKEKYNHTFSKISLRLNADQDKRLHFTINEKALSYLFLNQEMLASLEEVDFILSHNATEELKNIRDSDEFKQYFEAPFSEESMMIQAMVKKFKMMGDEGLKKLAYLMQDMDQCFQGKNQAIWDHYLIESKPLCMAELKNVTTWLVRLQDVKNPYITDADLQSSYKMSRKQLATIIFDMLKADHICRRHFTDIHTDDAQRLKALLGMIVELEGASKDRIILGQTLKLALDILIKLSNPDEFYKNIDDLCKIHKVYLPANKFDDQLSAASIEVLIQQLSEKDIEGRGDLLEFQHKMRLFVKKDDFLKLLKDFNNETGQKLRMLISGYVENNWPVGLLNLMEFADGNNLNEVIQETFNNTKIDKDIDLTYLSLEKILLRELVTIKRQNINAIAENLAGMRYAEIPHDIKYLEGLMGGIIGLRDPKKELRFDTHGDQVSSSVLSVSLQVILDLFHEQFTPSVIIDHLALMIKENKLSIIDPKTGVNIISQILGFVAKEQLALKGITEDTYDLDLLLLDDNEKKEAMRLSLALLLTKLGILKEVDENSNIVK